MQRMKTFCVLALAITFCIGIGSVAQAGITVTVDVTDDGYRFEHPGGSMWMWYNPFSKSYNQHGPTYNAYGVMNFDIVGALGGYSANDIISADLKFYVTDKQGSGADPYPDGTEGIFNIKVYSWEDPQWSEGADDAGMPQNYVAPLEITQSHTTGFNVWETVDFTEIVKMWLTFGEDNGIEIWDGIPADDLGWFWNAREAGSNRPYLDVTVVPEPATMVLLVLGGLGVLLRRRRMAA